VNLDQVKQVYEVKVGALGFEVWLRNPSEYLWDISSDEGLMTPEEVYKSIERDKNA
jgi:hypothetical protein